MSGARFAEVEANANIALAKYWGKRDASANVPAVPSLSITLAGLRTRTRVALDPALERDTFDLGGTAASADALARTTQMLDRVREASGSPMRARVTSTNDFPTASGLASSASGFAALALAACSAYGLAWTTEQISDLARQSSASSARSLFGGFVELGSELAADGTLAAKQVAPPKHLDVRVLVCVTSEEKKDVASTSGMLTTAKKSPYYAAWLAHAPNLFRELRGALLEQNLEKLGELTEASALAMHASAIAAGVVYFTGPTLAAMRAVRELRAGGTGAWATMDAGPHVKVLCAASNAPHVSSVVKQVPGVLRVIETSPGEGARVVSRGGP